VSRNLLLLLAFLITLACIVPFLLGTRPARAEEMRLEPLEAVPTLIDELGRPARLAAVRSLVRRAMREGEPSPGLLAETLGHAGGHAALDGLLLLLDHHEVDVRVAALEAVERVGLRGARVARLIYRIAAECRGRERVAAVTTLGAVGDGRDVELLLMLAKAEDPDLRQSAFRALRELTGLRIPPVHARWAWQWRVLQRRASEVVPDGLAELDEHPDDPDAQQTLLDVGRYAWIELPLVDEYVRTWFQSPDQTKRCMACWLTAELRLADHGSMIESTRIYAYDGDLSREVERALEVLGCTKPEGGP
jgi:hypothetical protein